MTLADQLRRACPDCAYGQQEEPDGVLCRCSTCNGRGYVYPPPDGGQPVFCPDCSPASDEGQRR